MAVTGAVLRVAVAGAGMVSPYHLHAWRSVQGARVVAIADPDRDRARRRAVEFAIDAVYADVGEMLDAQRPDALDIAAGHAAHAPLCSAAAERGIAILCQKPLAPSLAEAQAIVAAVGGRTRFMIHENWRFRPWYRRALTWVESETIGTPRSLALDARSSGLLLQGATRPALDRQPMLATLGRLAIGELLVHHLDLACCLLGPLAVTGASTARGINAIRGETKARIALGGEASTAELTADMACPGAPIPVSDRMVLIGSAGAIAFSGNRLKLEGAPSLDVTFDLDKGYQDAYDAAIGHFAEAILHDRPFATPPEIHLAVLALVEEAYRFASATTDTEGVKS